VPAYKRLEGLRITPTSSLNQLCIGQMTFPGAIHTSRRSHSKDSRLHPNVRRA
jgi:hypothetical protein